MTVARKHNNSTGTMEKLKEQLNRGTC